MRLGILPHRLLAELSHPIAKEPELVTFGRERVGADLVKDATVLFPAINQDSKDVRSEVSNKKMVQKLSTIQGLLGSIFLGSYSKEGRQSLVPALNALRSYHKDPPIGLEVMRVLQDVTNDAESIQLLVSHQAPRVIAAAMDWALVKQREQNPEEGWMCLPGIVETGCRVLIQMAAEPEACEPIAQRCLPSLCTHTQTYHIDALEGVHHLCSILFSRWESMDTAMDIAHPWLLNQSQHGRYPTTGHHRRLYSHLLGTIMASGIKPELELVGKGPKPSKPVSCQDEPLALKQREDALDAIMHAKRSREDSEVMARTEFLSREMQSKLLNWAESVSFFVVQNSQKYEEMKRVSSHNVFLSLKEAVAAAPAYTIIDIAAGVYEESVTVEKNLMLRAAQGSGRQTILRGTDRPALIINCNAFAMVDLVIENDPTLRQQHANASIQILNGDVAIVNCHLTQMLVQRNGVPFVEKCCIAGLVLEDQAGGYFFDNEIHPHNPKHSAAIEVKSSGCACFVNNNIHGPGDPHIVLVSGRTTICRFTGNIFESGVMFGTRPGLAGTHLRIEGAQVLLTANHIRHAECGIDATDNAMCYVQRNFIYKSLSGARVGAGATLVLQWNFITAMGGEKSQGIGGVLICARAKATVSENCFWNSTVPHAVVEGIANPIIASNTFLVRKIMVTRDISVPLDGVLIRQSGGGAVMDNDFFGTSTSGVHVQTQATPKLQNNHFHGGWVAGARFSEGGKGVLMDNIFQYGDVGVLVESQANPNISCNSFEGYSIAGVMVDKGGLGIFKKNESQYNHVNILVCGKGSLPEFTNEDIRESRLTGIHVTDSGGGRFINCKVTKSDIGIQVSGGGQPLFDRMRVESCGVGMRTTQSGCPTLRQCRICHNTGHGLECVDDGQGKLINTKITNNAGCGLMVMDRSTPELDRCVIADNASHGLQILRRSNPQLSQCEIRKSGGSGVFMNDSDGQFMKNVISHSGSAGMVIEDQALPVAVDNVITESKEEGVIFRRMAQGRFARNKVSHVGTVGVVVESDSKPVIEENRVSDVGMSGLVVTGASKPTVNRNVVSNCKEMGIFIHHGSVALKENEVYGCQVGCKVDIKGACKLLYNYLHHATYANLVLDTKNNLQIHHCRLNDSEVYGLVYISGHVQCSENELRGNAGAGLKIDTLSFSPSQGLFMDNQFIANHAAVEAFNDLPQVLKNNVLEANTDPINIVPIPQDEDTRDRRLSTIPPPSPNNADSPKKRPPRPSSRLSSKTSKEGGPRVSKIEAAIARRKAMLSSSMEAAAAPHSDRDASVVGTSLDESAEATLMDSTMNVSAVTHLNDTHLNATSMSQSRPSTQESDGFPSVNAMLGRI